MKLIDYITGNRKGREARRIEREAMDDPFLHDALEGYDAVPGDPTDAIRRMQRRVTGAAGNCGAGFTGARRRRCCCAPAREDTC